MQANTFVLLLVRYRDEELTVKTNLMQNNARAYTVQLSSSFTARMCPESCDDDDDDKGLSFTSCSFKDDSLDFRNIHIVMFMIFVEKYLNEKVVMSRLVLVYSKQEAQGSCLCFPTHPNGFSHLVCKYCTWCKALYTIITSEGNASRTLDLRHADLCEYFTHVTVRPWT